MDQRVSFRLGFIVLVAASLAGCGRKGPLELPPNAATTPTQTQAASDAATPPSLDNPALIQPPNKFMDKPASAKLAEASRKPVHPINNAAQAPAKKPFILDPLL